MTCLDPGTSVELLTVDLLTPQPRPRWVNLTSHTTNRIIPIGSITSNVSVVMKPQQRENMQRMQIALLLRYVSSPPLALPHDNSFLFYRRMQNPV